MIIAPLAFSIAIALISSHPYNVRFVLTSLAGFVILLAMLLQQMPRRMKLFFGTLLFAVSLWADVQWFAVPRYGKDDLRAAVQAVYDIRPDAEKILVAPFYMDDSFYYYLFRQHHAAQVVPILDVETVREHADADVLILTRLQHVSDPAALMAAFQGSNPDRDFQSLEVAGVHILLADQRAATDFKPSPKRMKISCFPGDPAGCCRVED
jgi:hypothetical protein